MRSHKLEALFIKADADGMLYGFYVYKNRQVFGRYTSIGRKVIFKSGGRVPLGSTPSEALAFFKNKHAAEIQAAAQDNA